MSAGFEKRPGPPGWTQLLGIDLRKVGIGLGVLLLVALGGGVVYHEFRRWERGHLVAQAREYLAKGDFRSAALSAERALQLNFNDLEATRMVAALADRFGSPAAVFWRARVAELEPGNPQAALAWASTALRFGELLGADQALSRVNVEGRRTAAFHQVAGALALALRRYAVAERQFAAAAHLQPTNAIIRLDLATVRLQSADPAVLEAARAELERLRSEPPCQTLALRALAADAERSHDTNRALRLTQELQDSPRAGLEDRLAYLDWLRRLRRPGFTSYLRQLERASDAQPGTIYKVATWMNARGLADQSLAWLSHLRPGLAAQLPVPLAMAEAAALARDWGRLESLVASGHWGRLDCLRLAFYARLLRERGQERGFNSRWREALDATFENPQLRSLLARVVEGWGWKLEAEGLWWKLANGDSDQAEALDALYHLYRASRDTEQLYRVTRRILELNPADQVAKNNLAQLSLLLNRNAETAHRLAAEVYRADPHDPGFISTYAFSLHRQGRQAEALKVFDRIPAALRRQPAMAVYYGALLLANGHRAEARRYFALADRSTQLLPEEQAMVTAALNQLER